MGSCLQLPAACTTDGSSLPASPPPAKRWRGDWWGAGRWKRDGFKYIRAFKCQVTDVFPFRRKVSLLLSHFFWGKARGGRWERANWFLLLCNPTQVQILISFWMKNPSWPPHPGPWETTSSSCTNLPHLLQMSDGKAAALWTLLLPPSQGSLRVPPSITACPAPRDLLLSRLLLAQQLFLPPPAQNRGKPCWNPAAGLCYGVCTTAQGASSQEVHREPQLQGLQPPTKEGLILTCPISCLPNGRPTLLPAYPLSPFHPLPQRSHAWL